MNARLWDAQTVLHHAAQRGSPAVVRVLVAAGADVQARNAFGRTVLEVAEKRGDPEVVQILREAIAVRPKAR